MMEELSLNQNNDIQVIHFHDINYKNGILPKANYIQQTKLRFHSNDHDPFSQNRLRVSPYFPT